jgi:glycosyltransferase involved in cell wall biosynthesis
VTTAPTDDRIAVVIPTRNRRKLLERLLGQLLRPSVADAYDVIVVDEASTDDTPQYLDRLVAEGRITAIRNDPPRYLPGARNTGLDAATGRYVAWIDDDDLTSPDRLIRQRDALVASGLRWSCAAKVDIDDDLQIIGHRACPSPDGFLRELLVFNCLPAAAQGLLVERSLAVEVGGYDRDFRASEDWEFCIRLAAIAEPHFLDEPLVGYRTGYESMSTDSTLMEDSIRAVYAKHAALMAEQGVEPDWAAVHQSLLTVDLLTSRRAAVRRGAALLRADPSPRNIARTAAVLLAPERFARQSAARRREQVPADWIRQARTWLDDV